MISSSRRLLIGGETKFNVLRAMDCLVPVRSVGQSDGHSSWQSEADHSLCNMLPDLQEAYALISRSKWNEAAERLERAHQILRCAAGSSQLLVFSSQRLDCLVHNQVPLVRPTLWRDTVNVTYDEILRPSAVPPGTDVVALHSYLSLVSHLCHVGDAEHKDFVAKRMEEVVTRAADVADAPRLWKNAYRAAALCDIQYNTTVGQRCGDWNKLFPEVERAITVDHLATQRKLIGKQIQSERSQERTVSDTERHIDERAIAVLRSAQPTSTNTPEEIAHYCALCLTYSDYCPTEILQDSMKRCKAMDSDGNYGLLTAHTLAALGRHYQYNYIYAAGLYQSALALCEAWFSRVPNLTEGERTVTVNRLMRNEYVKILRELGQRKEADSLCRRYGILM